MAANSRFAVAVHAVTKMAFAGDQYITSEDIAVSVNTNPVVIRRILSALAKAKIVESQTGKSGGSRLARKADQIALAEIYRAIEGERIFAVPSKPHNKSCAVSVHMKKVLIPVLDGAHQAMEEYLNGVVVSDVVGRIRQNGKLK